MEDPTNILWEMSLSLVSQKNKSSIEGWSLRNGLEVFCNPEARCPNCEKWIPTNRIWLIDDYKAILIGCWHTTNGSQVVKNIIHPHVAFGGEVCLGNNKEASSTLFAAIDKGHHYYNTEEWFVQLGHDCPNVKYVECRGCGDGSYQPISDIYLLCDDCEDKKAECIECGAWVDISTQMNEKCESCQIQYCLHCGDNEVDSGREYCDYCTCSGCGGLKDNTKNFCYECGPYMCLECDTGVKEEDSLCSECTDGGEYIIT